MPGYYRCRLKITPRSSAIDEQLAVLRERPEVTVTRRQGQLTVTVLMGGTDLTGALIRTQNLVLELVPGDITYAEITATDDEPPKPRRQRPGERKRPRTRRRSGRIA